MRNATDYYILPIITLQKKIIRASTFSPYIAQTKSLCIQLNKLPIRKLVIHRIAVQMYKYNIGVIPDITNYFRVTNSNVHSYNTRNRIKIRSAFNRHKYMYRNFRFISVHIWNLVISHININVILSIFKLSLKDYISEEFNLHTFLERAIS